MSLHIWSHLNVLPTTALRHKYCPVQSVSVCKGCLSIFVLDLSILCLVNLMDPTSWWFSYPPAITAMKNLHESTTIRSCLGSRLLTGRVSKIKRRACDTADCSAWHQGVKQQSPPNGLQTVWIPVQSQPASGAVASGFATDKWRMRA